MPSSNTTLSLLRSRPLSTIVCAAGVKSERPPASTLRDIFLDPKGAGAKLPSSVKTKTLPASSSLPIVVAPLGN